jgi:hypothetical protein
LADTNKPRSGRMRSARNSTPVRHSSLRGVAAILRQRFTTQTAVQMAESTRRRSPGVSFRGLANCIPLHRRVPLHVKDPVIVSSILHPLVLGAVGP